MVTDPSVVGLYPLGVVAIWVFIYLFIYLPAFLTLKKYDKALNKNVFLQVIILGAFLWLLYIRLEAQFHFISEINSACRFMLRAFLWFGMIFFVTLLLIVHRKIFLLVINKYYHPSYIQNSGLVICVIFVYMTILPYIPISIRLTILVLILIFYFLLVFRDANQHIKFNVLNLSILGLIIFYYFDPLFNV